MGLAYWINAAPLSLVSGWSFLAAFNQQERQHGYPRWTRPGRWAGWSLPLIGLWWIVWGLRHPTFLTGTARADLAVLWFGELSLVGLRGPGRFSALFAGIVGLLALFGLNHLMAQGLLAHPLPLKGAPSYPIHGWPTALWLTGCEEFAAVAGLSLGSRAGTKQQLVRGLLALTGTVITGFFFTKSLMGPYLPAWANLMDGSSRHWWYWMADGVMGLFCFTGLRFWARGPGGRVAALVTSAVLVVGLGLLVHWATRAMVPDFATQMGQAALLFGVVGAVIGILGSANSLWQAQRLLLIGVSGLWSVALTGAFQSLAMKNHWVPRPSIARVPSTTAAEIQAGRELAQNLGCYTCHGVNGTQDRPNPGDPGQWVWAWNSAPFHQVFGGPSGRQKLWTLLWNGQYAYRMTFYPHQHNWSVAYDTIDNHYNVPAWNGIVTAQQMQWLVSYIQSLSVSPTGKGR